MLNLDEKFDSEAALLLGPADTGASLSSFSQLQFFKWSLA